MGKTMKWVVIGLVVAFAVGLGFGVLGAATGADLGLSPLFIALFLGVFVAYIGGNLAGNRKTPKASADVRAKALTLTTDPDSALLVIYREGFVGKAAGMNVLLDEREIAQLKAPRFTAVSIAPGAHALRLAFGGLAGPQNNDAVAEFTVSPGDVAVFRASLSMGAFKNSIKVDRIEGDLALLRQKLDRMPMTAPDETRV